VNIWNYETCENEISQAFAEECLAVAFHPSGLHLVVALQDKMQMCNVLSRQLTTFKLISLKGVTEIQFSNGGQYFACTVGKLIYVHNFWTTDGTYLMECTGHNNSVRCIDWWENDQGFTSCCNNGNVYFYELYGPRGPG